MEPSWLVHATGSVWWDSHTRGGSAWPRHRGRKLPPWARTPTRLAPRCSFVTAENRLAYVWVMRAFDTAGSSYHVLLHMTEEAAHGVRLSVPPSPAGNRALATRPHSGEI